MHRQLHIVLMALLLVLVVSGGIRADSVSGQQMTRNTSYIRGGVSGPPAAVITGPSVLSTKTGPVTYCVRFSTPVTGFGSADDIQVYSTGSATAGAVDVAGAGDSYTVTLSGITGNGAMSIAVNAGSCVDSAGKANTASAPSAKVTVLGRLQTVSGHLNLQDYRGDITQVPVSIELRKQGYGSPVQNRTVYLTGNGSYTLTDVGSGMYDMAFKASHWLRKTVKNVSVSDQPVNLVPNGSFEAGMGEWVGWDDGSVDRTKYGEITTVKDGLISSEAYLGRQSFCFNFPGFIQSRYVNLDPLKSYTISFYAKSNQGNEWIAPTVISSYRDGAGGGDTKSTVPQWFLIGSDWSRFQATVTLPESRNGCYRLALTHWGSGKVWLDGVQLEEGDTATTHSAAYAGEIGMTTGAETMSNLFYVDETIPVTTRLHVDKPIPQVQITYSLYDHRCNKVAEWIRMVNPDAEGYAVDTQTLNPQRKGLISLIATAQASGVYIGQQELVFGVVSHPLPVSSDDENSPLGVHVAGTWSCGVAEKLGIRWERMHDVFDNDSAMYWSYVEPTAGVFVFGDAGVDRYRSNGFNLMPVLWDVPVWAGSPNTMPDLTLWRTYVRELVTHFRGRVKYWEVWNEPFSWSWWSDTPEDYYLLLRATYEEAKAADPNCKIVGGCQAGLDYGTVRDFTTRLFNAGGLNYMDIFSVHALGGLMLPTGPSLPEERVAWDGGTGKTATQTFNDITSLMVSYGQVKPIWNTETDVWCQPFSLLHPFVEDTPWNVSYPPMPPDMGADYLVQATVVSMANNVPKSMMYTFSRDGGRYEDDMTQTMLSGRMELKSTAVVSSELLLQLGRATFYKELAWGGNARCYLFNTPEGPLAVAWGLSGGGPGFSLRLPQSAGGFTYLDIMGNLREDIVRSVDGCSLTIDSEPLWVRASDMNILEQALSQGSFYASYATPRGAANQPVGITQARHPGKRQTAIASPSLPTISGGVGSCDVSLFNGDCNGDNRVDIRDLIKIVRAYGSRPGSSTWDPNADLNGNNRVDMMDQIIVRRNYGRVGDR